MLELVPLPVGRVSVADSTLEEGRTVAGVGKDAVQQDVHPQPVGLVTEGLEVRLSAQHGVDLLIVGGVIAVVGPGLEDRRQIDDGHAHLPQRRELLPDAAEVSAEKVVVGDLAVLIGPPIRQLTPVGVDAVRFDLAGQVAVTGLIIAVREDLIDHGPSRPLWNLHPSGNGADLPTVASLHVGAIPLLEQAEAALLLVNAEVVVIEAAAQANLAGELLIVAGFPGKGHGKGQAAGGAGLIQNDLGTKCADVLRDVQS